MDSQCEKRFVEKISALAAGLSKKGRIKNYDKVMLSIGRLKEKYARVAQHYDIKLTKADKGSNAASLSFERINHEAQAYAGVYCLRTNIPDWDDEKLWRTYIMLTDLEAVFRSMKSELGMRPVYHQKTARVEGHLWITLLAYHLVHYIRLRLKDHDIHDSWETLRRTMRGHMRVTTTMRTRVGDRYTAHPQSCLTGGAATEHLQNPWLIVQSRRKCENHYCRQRVKICSAIGRC